MKNNNNTLKEDVLNNPLIKKILEEELKDQKDKELFMQQIEESTKQLQEVLNQFTLIFQKH